MLRGDELLGVTVIYRVEVRPFAASHIALMETFSGQAVIAIENVRLFEEVQVRTHDLTEALQQQTATADVLKIISRSVFDLDSVLNTLCKSATDLCRATGGNIHLRDGDVFRVAAQVGWPETFKDYMRAHPLKAGRESVVGRAVQTGAVAHIPDVLDDPDYAIMAGQKMAGYRALIGVPLIRDGEVIGAFSLGRETPGPFAPREMEVVRTFADQAVMAIGNVRLFDEVQQRNRELTEALEQQTATSAILRVIASSPTDIQPVLNTVAESAAKLCEAYDVAIALRDEDGVSLANAAHFGTIPIRARKLPIGRDWPAGRAFVDRQPVHVPDLADAAEEFPFGHAMAVESGFRSSLAVPLLREGEAIGIIGIRRLEVRPFTKKQIDLLTTFADQAVIAIENVRLFEEVQARNRDLTEALEQQTATGAILRAIAESPTDVQPVLDAVAENAAKLCGAYDAVIVLVDGNELAARSHHGPMPISFSKLPLNRDWVTGRAVIDRTPIHVHDLLGGSGRISRWPGDGGPYGPSDDSGHALDARRQSHWRHRRPQA